MVGRFSPALPLDTFSSPLRNIKLFLDGTRLMADLIPSVTLEEETQIEGLSDDPQVEAQLQSALGKGRPIVESSRACRIEFVTVQALIVQEEFVELFDILSSELDSLPKIIGSNAAFPIVVDDQSDWKRRLPDYQGGEDPELKHFKIFSMETEVDILARLLGFEWVQNSP